MNGEAMIIQREPIVWKIKKAFRKLLSQVVLWVSVAVIAIIAIPTVVFGRSKTGILQQADPKHAKHVKRE